MPTRMFKFLTLILVLLAAPAHAREVLDLSEGWRFRFGEMVEDTAQPGFDDSTWEQVTVPHSWNRIGEYALERSPETNNAQGAGWYRLAINAPKAAKGMRQYLDFAAVGAIADVWVNGIHVGTHKGAFSRFRFDVTAAWKPGEANLVAVRADNSKPAAGSPTEHVIPLAGDFFIHGGIYRQVALVTANEVGIDLLDYGGPGVYVDAGKPQTREVLFPHPSETFHFDEEVAPVSINVRLRNKALRTRRLELLATVRDGKGIEVARGKRKLSLPDGASQAEVGLFVKDPILWSGRANPHLYSVTVSLLQSGREVDSVTQNFGIREFSIDPDKGFFLNREHLKLHGVSRHQDRLGKGWALSPADHAEDMALIAELGANTVRQGHYQHADEWSDEADKAGMVVWAELPYVGAPSLTGGKGSADLWANAEQQLRELIRQNYNHPSIMMWSIGNEVDSAQAFGAVKDPPSPIDLLKRLNEIAKQEDPLRQTIFADFSEDFGPFGKSRQPMTGVADMVAYNRYYGWYYMQAPNAGQILGGSMDKLHAKHPAIPMGVSEYGAGSGLSQFSDDPASGFVAMAGRPQTEEYAALVHERLWPAIASRDYIFGSWVWNMFDFVSDLRNEGDSVDINTKGLVSMDRKVKKDAFWFYKAAWSKTPVLHLTGKRYVERSYSVMDVKAYTNQSKASLSVNGTSIGEVECPNSTCVWKAVRLAPGENRAEVRSGELSDSTLWNGPDPAANGIRIDAGNIAASQLGGKRYGSDSFVTGGKSVARFAGAIGGRGSENLPVAADTPALYEHWRAGDSFAYAIPLRDGEWTVTVHTLEPGAAKADPMMAQAFGIETEAHKPVVMSVSANGKLRIAKLDAAKQAGATRKGIARAFPVTVKGGLLTLDFAGVAGGSAVVAAIEIAK